MALIAPCACVLLQRGSYDRAAALLQASGRWSDAVQLCLTHQLLQSLRGVCSELRQQIKRSRTVEQPELAARAATYLAQNGYAEEGIALVASCGLPEEVRA